MWLLTYDGKRVESSARHPEQLVILAPKRLQDACECFGGKNQYGKPIFRLVRVSSRYMIAGGLECTFLDEHGNYQKTCPAEMLLPRYPMAEPVEWNLWLLERWRPPQWYYANGFGKQNDVEWDAQGKAIRCMEPVWSEGGYEACWWEVGQLFVLPTDVAAEGMSGRSLSIEQAIWAVRRRGEVSAAAIARRMTEERAAQREQDIKEGAELIIESGHPDIFLEPTISMSGAYKKEEVWQKSELSVSEPAVA